nr:hypothetical protein [Microbacterium bovistercoris]
MGIFSKQIARAYAPTSPAVPLAVASPWMPTDALTQWTVDQLYADAVKDSLTPVNRDIALRIGAVKRAHGVQVGTFSGVPYHQMDNAVRTTDQPFWLTNSRSGVSPYHRMYGIGSDFFFNGWACLGFDRDPLDPDADCMHAPYGAWGIDPETGRPWIDQTIVPRAYTAYPVVISVGYGDNGLLQDGADTIREARQVEAAYADRVANPVPLTLLGIPQDVWERWTPEERKQYRDQYVAGRKAANGSVAMKVAEFPVEFPGSTSVDLYESGRNAVRLDIANHTDTPASMLEGVRQGGSGGGTEMRYSGVANGNTRAELWDFGASKRWLAAFEARMSLDDICPTGLSIRGDLTNMFALPEPTMNPTSED